MVQGEHEDLVGGGKVLGGAGGEDGNAKAAGYRFADGFQVVHAGYNVQGSVWDIMFFQIAVDFLFGARAGFAHNKGLLEKIGKVQGSSGCLLLILKVMLVDWSGNYKFIFAKGDKTAVRFVKGISNQSHVHTAIQNPCHSAQTVGLPGMEIDVWDLAGKGI